MTHHRRRSDPNRIPIIIVNPTTAHIYPGTSFPLPSVAPIPTEWPSIPPGLASVSLGPGVPPNVGVTSVDDVSTPSPSPANGANPTADAPPSQTGSSDSTSPPSRASTSTFPSPNQTLMPSPDQTAESGLQTSPDSPSSPATPTDGIPRTSNAARPSSVHTRTRPRVIAALLLLWMSVVQLGRPEVLVFG
ncbi:unnamed protein product [Cyclocybe aegerita]|uniref:Uncharacterized protein n=1 Tax=Cyclocybe aegerita TaxID=1973307 RepID=A0A8S0WE91_CYCAE|nr:unnamed protein product [Cyclocybe aegerita]